MSKQIAFGKSLEARGVVRDLFIEAERQGYPLKDLAAKLVLPAGHISRWRRGTCAPNYKSIIAFAALLGFKLALVPITDED